MQIFPLKGAYLPDEPLSFTVAPRDERLAYEIKLYDKEQCVFEGSFSGTQDLVIPPLQKPFAGYCGADSGGAKSRACYRGVPASA